MMKTKKISALLLSILLIFSVFTVNTFAADETDYLVLGDSIAYGSGLANPIDACYGKIIADTCEFEYNNYSVPGATTNDLIARLAAEEVASAVKEAEIISISIGGNDFLMNNIVGLMFDAIVKEDYSTFDRIGENFYANLCEIIGIIRESNEDALILLQTLYNPQEGYLRAPYQEGANRINEGILRFAQENPENIAVVNVGDALKDDMDNFAGDAIHPSAKGNELIAREILSVLNAEGITDKTELVCTVKAEDFNISPVFALSFKMYGIFFHILSVVFRPIFSILG